jgi:hypothetical protein
MHQIPAEYYTTHIVHNTKIPRFFLKNGFMVKMPNYSVDLNHFSVGIYFCKVFLSLKSINLIHFMFKIKNMVIQKYSKNRIRFLSTAF